MTKPDPQQQPQPQAAKPHPSPAPAPAPQPAPGPAPTRLALPAQYHVRQRTAYLSQRRDKDGLMSLKFVPDLGEATGWPSREKADGLASAFRSILSVDEARNVYVEIAPAPARRKT